MVQLISQSHPEVVQAGKDALDKYGAGLSSVRFICGTQSIHKVRTSMSFTLIITPDHLQSSANSFICLIGFIYTI